MSFQGTDYTNSDLRKLAEDLINNGIRVTNQSVSAAKIVATGNLDDLYSAYIEWIANNPSLTIINVIPINLSSERGILITYYE